MGGGVHGNVSNRGYYIVLLSRVSLFDQGFVTDNERALEQLFGDEEDTRKGDACLSVMATRIATVFASLKVQILIIYQHFVLLTSILSLFILIFQEFPFVRYRAARSLDVTTMTTFSDLIPTKLAARVWDRLMHYKTKFENFPQTETCDLLILDRSIDQV